MDVSVSRESDRMLTALAARRFTPWKDVDRRLLAERRSLAKGFDRLLALEEVRVVPFPHQRAAALQALREMRGRALLADEVGLGKTIESGLVLKEYMLRGLVRRALILAPAPLLEQWRDELQEKFAIDADIVSGANRGAAADCVIASLDWAKRPDRAARFHETSWDLVIVDEAHRLKNRRTAAWRFVDGLRKKYLLLLTATPIQNDLEELYNIITLLKPGLLRTYSSFRDNFMDDRRSAKDVERLRQHVAEVMIRHTRRDCGVRLPPRRVRAVPVRMTDAERAFYDDVLAFARRVYALRARGDVLPLVVLLREVCSSPRAAGSTLRQLEAADDLPKHLQEQARILAGRAGQLDSATTKQDAALAVLARCREPVVVFTEFRATQDALCEALQRLGIHAVRFHGGMNRAERRAALDAFRSSGGVLVSTEAGGEGQNWQFCRFVVNYDLPWNPMRLEQRIGRVHRLGQTRAVSVVNLYTENTIETYVYRLLEEKLRLFRQVVGDLDLVLSEAVGDAEPLELQIGRIVLAAGADAEIESAFAELGQRLAAGRALWEAARRRNEELLEKGRSPSTGDRKKAGGDGTPADVSPAAPADRTRLPTACVLHPLSLDAEFAAGVLAERPNAHPAAQKFHQALQRIRFDNVRARAEGRRLVHHRQLIVWFKVAYRSDETRERLCAVAVDPLTERARLLDEWPSGFDVKLDARDLVLPAHDYAVQRLFRQALRQISRIAARAGRLYQAEASARLSRERARLETYFDELEAEALSTLAHTWQRLEAARTRSRLRRALLAAGGEEAGTEAERRPDAAGAEETIQQVMADLAAAKRARLDELERKYEVRAETKPVAAAFLWAPKVECRYKLFGPGRRDVVFHYDPLVGSIIDASCDVCEKPLDVVWICREGDLVCSSCYSPCAGCGKELCRACASRRCHVCDALLCSDCPSDCPSVRPVLASCAQPLHVCPACRAHTCRRCARLGTFLVV